MTKESKYVKQDIENFEEVLSRIKKWAEAGDLSAVLAGLMALKTRVGHSITSVKNVILESKMKELEESEK